jgi:signal transduction histidine kinase
MLSAGIAHEINNPINFVYAGINSLLRDFEDIKPVITKINDLKYDDENLKEKVKSIEKLKKENYFDEAFGAIPEILEDIKLGADRTAEIVKGLRVFSGSDKNESELIDIHEAINTSLILLKNKYKRRINIIQNYGNNIPLLNCFPVKINQAFLNIISNAIDAIEGEGKIWITTRKEKNNIVVSIKDSGKGIDKKIINKLFDPFFTTKDVGKGTGLGLAITYGIIQEHNGSIKVVSEPGKGTEFIITLPLTDKD